MGASAADDHHEFLAFLRQESRQLSPEDQQIATMRFGLEDGVVRGLEDVGATLRVTREHIRHVEARLMSRWRRHLRAGE